MFNYFLSVAVAFIVFGTAFNILKKVCRDTVFENFDDDELTFFWILVILISFAWFFTIPILVCVLVIYLLKLLTDKIASTTIQTIEKRKLKKQTKESIKDI